MKKYDSRDEVILFRHHVGTGTFRGREFTLSVTATPSGDLTGMPIVEVDGMMVAFEMGDVMPAAFDLMGIVPGEDKGHRR